MISWNNYTGTETNPLSQSSTEIRYAHEYYRDNTELLIKLNSKELRIRKNAIKATQTMVLLSKNYKPSVFNLMLTKCAFRIYKILFSISGKLPKRIRRIRKGR